MRSKILKGTILAAAITTMTAPSLAQKQEPRVRSIEIFDGAVATDPGVGASKRVTVQQLIIDGNQEIQALPHDGELIVELKAGDLTTVIDGKRVERQEGEIWQVPAGKVMALETEDDSAIIKTTVISTLAN